MDPVSLDAELTAQANSLRRLARDLLADAHLAEDAVQDAMQAAIERPPAARSALPAWLRTVVTHRAFDLRRGERRRRAREAAAAREAASVTTTATDRQVELQQRVLAAVQSLAEPYRTTIWQRYYEDRSPRAIAALSGEPVKTVKTRLWRALHQLRQELDARSGSRGAWVGLLSPFAAPSSSCVVPVGAVLMSASTKLGVTLAVLVTLAATLWWRSAATPPLPAALPATEALAAAPAIPNIGATPESGGSATERSADLHDLAARTHAVLMPEPPPKLAIDGVVLDLDGRPVPGVGVAWNGAPVVAPSAPFLTTDRDGVFRFERTPGMGMLVVTDPRFVPVLQPVLFDSDKVHHDLTIVVAPSVRLEGVVVGNDGRPISGAQIAVSLGLPLRTRIARVLDRCVDAKFEALTPDDGMFTIAMAPLAAAARLVVDAPGHRQLEVPVEEARHQQRFVLERTVEGDVLDGVVVDVDGAVVPKAVLMLHDHSVVTEPDGTFRLELWRVGDLPAGTLPELTAATSHHLPGKVAASSPQWRSRGAWPAPLRVQVGGPVATIRGRVVRHDGTAFADPWVSFVPPEPDQIRLTVFDAFPQLVMAAFGRGSTTEATPDAANGEFETARVAPGRYRLVVYHPTTLELLVSEPLSTGPAPVEIRMPDRGFWPALRGVVVDRRGEPVPGADWMLERDDPTPGASAPRTGLWHQATAQGGIEHPPCSRDVRTLCVKAAGMAEWVRIELLTLARVDDFRVVVPIGCQVRIEVGPNWPGVDRANLVDASGAHSPVVFTNGDIATGTHVIPLVEGRSQTFAALDDCVALVLCRGNDEVGRVPVVLRPGEVNVLRP